MSTVKLITPYNQVLFDVLQLHKNIRILVALGPDQKRQLAISKVIKNIFEPYSGKLVIFGEYSRGDLPVPEYTYRSEDNISATIARGAVNDIIDDVLNYSNERVHSSDGIVFYDVYQIWKECRNLESEGVFVPKLLNSVYGTTNVDDVAPWGGKTIGEMKAAADKEQDYERIINADLKFPVILRWGHKMVDGHHRLIKCALLNKRLIRAIVISGDRLRRCKISVPIDEYYKQF